AILRTLDFLADRRPAVPALASGLSRVHSLKRRLTLILDRRPPKRLSGLGRAAVVAAAAALLPLLPTLARPEPTPEPEKSAATPEGAKGDVEEPTAFSPTPLNLLGGNSEVFSVAYSPDGRYLAAGGGYWDRPGFVQVWDLKARTRVFSFREER